MADGSDSGSSGYAGQLAPTSPGSHFNMHSFLVDQAMGFMRTHVLVEVKKVHAGQNNGPPTVDVQILTKQTDGQGNSTSHGTIYGIPVKRNQSGDCVIINDPIVGDIGEMAIHDRDISAVVSSQKEANPGSQRRFSPSDGTYYGTVGSKTSPNHFIQFARDGNGNVTSVNLTSSAGWNINGITVDPKGNAAFPGTITAKGDITAGEGSGDSVTLQNHLHSGVQPGAANTQKPVAGT